MSIFTIMIRITFFHNINMIRKNSANTHRSNRPGKTGANTSGRGVLSMHGLSHGVVRVDNETSLTSLTLQDSGQVLPGGLFGVAWVLLLFCG